MAGFRLGACLAADIDRESVCLMFGCGCRNLGVGLHCIGSDVCRACELRLWDLIARLCFALRQALECFVPSRRLVCRVALGDVLFLGVPC